MHVRTYVRLCVYATLQPGWQVTMSQSYIHFHDYSELTNISDMSVNTTKPIFYVFHNISMQHIRVCVHMKHMKYMIPYTVLHTKYISQCIVEQNNTDSDYDIIMSSLVCPSVRGSVSPGRSAWDKWKMDDLTSIRPKP